MIRFIIKGYVWHGQVVKIISSEWTYKPHSLSTIALFPGGWEVAFWFLPLFGGGESKDPVLKFH